MWVITMVILMMGWCVTRPLILALLMGSSALFLNVFIQLMADLLVALVILDIFNRPSLSLAREDPLLEELAWVWSGGVATYLVICGAWFMTTSPEQTWRILQTFLNLNPDSLQPTVGFPRAPGPLPGTPIPSPPRSGGYIPYSGQPHSLQPNLPPRGSTQSLRSLGS